MFHKTYFQLSFWLLLTTFLWCFQTAFSQQSRTMQPHSEPACGTAELTAQEYELYREWAKLESSKTISEQENAVIRYAPVVFHIVQNTDGDGVTVAEVEQALVWANQKFAPSNIQLYQCSPPNIIVNNSWYNTEFIFEWENSCEANTPEYDFDAAFHIPNVINIYCVNTNGWSWAAFPWRKDSHCHDWVVFHQGHVTSEWLLAHELGHYFGLLHTFSGNDENVTRNFLDPCFNCATEGDLLCDTPADHHVSAEWSPGCDPDDKFDDCGVLLVPNGLNLMSYSNSDCPAGDKYFTTGQNNRMNDYFTNGRSYLNCTHDCVASYNLGGAHGMSRTYRAWDFIQSTATVGAALSVTYQAGDYIQLLPGFIAFEGSLFTAQLSDCIDDSDNFNRPSQVNEREDFSAEPAVSEATTSPAIFKAYPSPFSNRLSIEFEVEEGDNLSLGLYNMAGKLVQPINIGTPIANILQKIEIDTYTLPTGIYFATLRRNGTPQTVKVVKME